MNDEEQKVLKLGTRGRATAIELSAELWARLEALRFARQLREGRAISKRQLIGEAILAWLSAHEGSEVP